ncbi:MAG: enoyl-CoA hydratase-related protein [Pseudomonadota bacterium]|nr:MAG: enoyl-CoA hydratase [Pseudomonadota bacterium]
MDAFSLSVRDPVAGVRLVEIRNEARRNAVDGPALVALREEFLRAEAEGVRCVVLTGAGTKAFCAGYDLRALAARDETQPLPDEELGRTLAVMERLRAPILAALNGAAYGAGAELAAACDLRIAQPGVRLAMPPARLGIVYAPAGLQRFVELVGLSQAKRLFFTGDPVEADEALAIGLVDEVAPEGGALSRALELAARIAKNAPLAVQGMKRAFALMRRRELPPAAHAEVEALRRASYASEDFREGLRAALERREPVFLGR